MILPSIHPLPDDVWSVVGWGIVFVVVVMAINAKRST
jgi:hypothetical protein